MRTPRAIAAALTVVTIGGSLLGLGSAKATTPDAVGLTKDGKALVAFATNAPAKAKAAKKVTGLAGDTSLVGIDYRVQNNKLYGVGNSGGIYLIDDQRAKASKVGQIVTGLTGTSFGVDFNPAANALRIVSNTGQNLRQPFGTGDNPMGDTVTDGSLNTNGGITNGIAGAAYTNNDLNADTATSLFVIDATLDQVALQSPANSGSLAATGKLGVDAGPAVGFDIYSEHKFGKTVAQVGLATLEVKGTVGLYGVDVLTGTAVRIGTFSQPIGDLAVSTR